MPKEETEGGRLKRLRDENDGVPPPNPWSNTVQTYGVECKSNGAGTKRVHTDMGTFIQRHVNEVKGIGDVSFEKMHYVEWIHFTTMVKRYLFH